MIFAKQTTSLTTLQVKHASHHVFQLSLTAYHAPIPLNAKSVLLDLFYTVAHVRKHVLMLIVMFVQVRVDARPAQLDI